MNNEQIQNLIKELIEKTGVTTTQISITEDKQNTWFGIEVNEPHFFIEQGGEALHALNHLVKRIIENKTPSAFGISPFAGGEESPLPVKGGVGERFIMIDINNFQKKRVEDVRSLAHMMSERARYFKSNIEVDPMSAFERRIVHEFLADALDLKTESVGFGPTRRVVIKYVGN